MWAIKNGNGQSSASADANTVQGSTANDSETFEPLGNTYKFKSHSDVIRLSDGQKNSNNTESKKGYSFNERTETANENRSNSALTRHTGNHAEETENSSQTKNEIEKTQVSTDDRNIGVDCCRENDVLVKNIQTLLRHNLGLELGNDIVENIEQYIHNAIKVVNTVDATNSLNNQILSAGKKNLLSKSCSKMILAQNDMCGNVPSENGDLKTSGGQEEVSNAGKNVLKTGADQQVSNYTAPSILKGLEADEHKSLNHLLSMQERSKRIKKITNSFLI